MRPWFIALAAAALFLTAMVVPDEVRANLSIVTHEDVSVRSDLAQRFCAQGDLPDLMVVLSSERLAGDDANWYWHHYRRIELEATPRLAAAGIASVFLDSRTVDGELARRMASAPRLPDARQTGVLGVVRVDFAEDDVAFDGVSRPQKAPWKALEYTHHGKVTILLLHLPRQFGTDSCDETCAVVNLVCHGIGHALGFDDPGHAVPWMPISLGEWVRTWILGQPADVMMQGQKFDAAPLGYAMNKLRNRQAVKRIQRPQP
jgi:hypothetical protein